VLTPLSSKLDTLFIYVSFTIDHGEEHKEERGDENRRKIMERGVETRRTTVEDTGQRQHNITCFVSQDSLLIPF